VWIRLPTDVLLLVHVVRLSLLLLWRHNLYRVRAVVRPHHRLSTLALACVVLVAHLPVLPLRLCLRCRTDACSLLRRLASPLVRHGRRLLVGGGERGERWRGEGGLLWLLLLLLCLLLQQASRGRVPPEGQRSH